IAAGWSARRGRSGGEIGAHDCWAGRDTGRPVRSGLPQRIAIEPPQLRALVQGLEIADEPAADHVALERDVIASRVHGGMDFAVRRLAAAEDPDLDDWPLGDLAQELTSEIV